MFSLNPHFALLAAQCILSLIAFPSPASAIAVYSPHSDHREFSGGLHTRKRHPALLAAGGKERHPSGERGSSHAQKASRKHKPNDAALVAPDRTPNHHVADVKGGVGKRQPRDQQFFQTRDLTSIVVGVVDPLLQTADTTIKGVLGSDPLESILTRRRHHHNFRDHGVVIVNGDDPSVHIHRRSVQHTHRPTKRDLQGIPGIVAIIQNGTEVGSLFLQPDDYELNASTDKSTTMYLVQSTLDAKSALGVDPLLNVVQLLVPISGLQSYCATFDPNPSVPSQMTVEPCFPPSQGSEHKSQLFEHNLNSGSLRPMQNSAAVENSRGQGALTPVANQRVGQIGVNIVGTRDLGGLGGLGGLGDLVDLAFIPQPDAVELVEDDESSSSSETLSVTTVTVTETATQNPSPTAGTTSTTDVPESTGLSSASPSLPGTFDVDVALPSATSSSVSPEPSTNGDNSLSSEPSPTAGPDAIAASIASSDTSSTTMSSEASPQPTPASLLVQVTRPESLSTSTPARAST